jgi:N-acetylglucosaminyldiphosphoundecaprenol N-acetyl-beta-D-mannosaminyltransferase
MDLGKRNVLGVLVDVVDYDGALARIFDASAAGRALTVTALAVHGVMTGVLDRDQRWRLNQFDLVTPDGQPVRWALNLLYRLRLPERVYGPELVSRICARAAQQNLPIFLYGNRPEVLGALERRLCDRFQGLRIAGSLPSAFRRLSQEEQDTISGRIRASGARLTLVGLGCPRQEVWVFENARALAMPAVAVGAAFDFHAGARRQAPRLLQRLGLEWLFRLALEPRRLWRRYLLLNPAYLALLAAQVTRLWRPAIDDTQPKLETLRYG